MDICILGPLDILDGDRAIEVTGSKRRLLLTLLAVRAPDTVPIDALVDALWPQSTSEASPATLQTYVYQLRKLLGPGVVVTRPPGYALGVPADCVDAFRFEQLLHANGAEDEAADSRRARLAAALELWRAPPFLEFPEVPSLAGEAARLTELRLRALEDRVDADLAVGRHGEIVAELESLVTENPLRERFWAQLMLALYRSERQTEALRAFARLRRHLADEIGIEPSRALVRLEQQILDHDEALACHREPPRRAAAGPAPSPAREADSAAFLFTDIEGSTRRWESTPDAMSEALSEHDRIVRSAVERAHGEIFATAGDSFAIRFADASDAVDAALQVQLELSAADWSSIDGLRVRMGIHVGRVYLRDGEMHGPTLNRVARLHAAAHGGQVLLSSAAAENVRDRLPDGTSLLELGEHRLRDIGQPERVHQLVHPLLSQTFPPLRADARVGDGDSPFVGRRGEIDHLLDRVERLRSGSGGVVMLVGEAGIGKTRTSLAVAQRARAGGAQVLWGRCIDGPWAPPYGPFAEAIAEHVRDSERRVTDVLGSRAPVLARLLPDELAEQVSDIATTQDIDALELQMRTFAAVTGFIVDLAATSPVVIVVDDMHWADQATIGLLQHLARAVARHPVLVLGNFRDDEVGPGHPLNDLLGTMPRDTAFERVRLRGIGAGDVGELARSLLGDQLSDNDVATVAADTGGNPFFVLQVLRQLQTRGADHLDESVVVPENVVDVIDHRVARLPDVTQRFLRAATVFDGDFEFSIGAEIAGLDEEQALDALDGALDAHLLNATERADSYRFVHALARQAVGAGLNPSRRLRLHRRAAEALAAAAATGPPDPSRAAEIAAHYQRSATLPGAEQGAGPAIVAAEHATAIGAHDDSIRYITMALELLPPQHPDRPDVLGRLGCAHALAAHLQEATAIMHEAIDLIAAAEGPDRAADFAVEATDALRSGLELFDDTALIDKGLRYVGDRRNYTWAKLFVLSVRDFPRCLQDPIFADASRIIMEHSSNPGIGIVLYPTYPTRADLLQLAAWPSARLWGAGDFRGTVVQFREAAAGFEREGRLLSWAKQRAYEAHARIALGQLDDAAKILDEIAATELPPTPSAEVETRLLIAAYLLASARDDDWDKIRRFATTTIESMAVAEQLRTGSDTPRAATSDIDLFVIGPAKILARLGDVPRALANIDSIVAHFDVFPEQLSFIRVDVHDFVEILWYTSHAQHLDFAEEAVRVNLELDLRSPMCDMRMSMARLEALRGNFDSAHRWFDDSRAVLEEAGARPLRAIVDFDEALMHQRRGADGDRDLALRLVEDALAEFRAIGMPGWIRRAEAMRIDL